ncbi:MAG: DNA mismatch repair protein MutS [Pseudoflavonifractor sp.]|nr:DNA mismatch repair protein MutS [Alloprevotella sp.]MCM1117410.1 DNA mismatch repair protein MutS [Pseudoflavonifractor sp.]
MAKKIAETPLMKQYQEMKAKHPDAVLLFRVGDFYETFSDDAITASEILGITLTRRANGQASHVELAGFPHHALDTYLPRLIRAGKRVAICEQLEDPKLTKKLVKRGITELVTPGTSMSDNLLSHRENNFLAAVNIGQKGSIGVAFLDISTGEFLCAEGDAGYMDKLLANFAPKEVLVERGRKKEFAALTSGSYLLFELDDWIFTLQAARDRLLRQFETSTLKGFGVESLSDAVIAAGSILHYLDITQHTGTGHIITLRRIEEERYVRLDRFTIRNLELLDPLAEGGRSLLSVIDRTVSPMGARLLRRWILFPLRDPSAINRRLDIVDHFFRAPDERDALRQHIMAIGDLERLAGKAAARRITPRELGQLRDSLKLIAPLKAICSESTPEPLRAYADQLNECPSLVERIDRELSSDPPSQLGKSDVIARGVNAELDQLRDIAFSGKDYLMALQAREIEATGIPSLKIGFNNVFGYYIEVTNTHKDKVPEQWIRKQTLVNAERYITQELKEYEEKIVNAQERIAPLEASLFNLLVTAVADYVAAIILNSNIIARLDCLSAFTIVAMENRYTRPDVDDSLVLSLTEARHPVIERQLPPGEPYIANSINLDPASTQIMMITGPNMSGKSALLRQTAINTLMAQIGCFVAADSAHIGVVDKIFTRVGASDNISLGESTFMVEMTEAASILNGLSPRSLVLFDELGRGTSTYDGISIAWAIVEYLHNGDGSPAAPHPKTLFATHYHELNEMERSYERVANFNVSVKEIGGKVVFLRRLSRGGSEHSFGIHVARLAGMPRSIVERADKVLLQLEESARASASPATAAIAPEQLQEATGGYQLSLFQLDDPVLAQVRDEILSTDIDNLTPIAALSKLNEIKTILTGH